jgi:hypothetical protein
MAKLGRGPNRAFGFDGLCVSAHGLKINHRALLEACLDHWRASTGNRHVGAQFAQHRIEPRLPW